MANKYIFRSLAGSPPPADTLNEAGGKAFALPPRQALAQYAVTGCLNGTFYASAETQLERGRHSTGGCSGGRMTRRHCRSA